MAMATTASVVIANILVATRPRPLCTCPVPRHGLCDSWLEVMTKSVGSRADTETTSTTCMHDINEARVVRIVQGIYIYMYYEVVKGLNDAENVLIGQQ